jgi:hypothetical protein
VNLVKEVLLDLLAQLALKDYKEKRAQLVLLDLLGLQDQEDLMD